MHLYERNFKGQESTESMECMKIYEIYIYKMKMLQNVKRSKWLFKMQNDYVDQRERSEAVKKRIKIMLSWSMIL